jgi:hypothetical protein
MEGGEPGGVGVGGGSDTIETAYGRIESVTFRSDHLDAKGKKVIVPTPMDTYGPADERYDKPEWRRGRSYPISHTMDKKVKVDVVVRLAVLPVGRKAQVTRLVGECNNGDYLSFEADVSKSQSSGKLTFTGLVAKEALPRYVTIRRGQIAWTLVVDGERCAIGTTGPHFVYVTLDQPGGKLTSPSNNHFEESGPDQDVTVARLDYACRAAHRTGKKNEQECVDAIFYQLMKLGVGYILGKRWENGGLNNTGVTPKPSLHHYLWMCNAAVAQGECHNIAAGFILACRILGVKGTFSVGYMYPWPSRLDGHPHYLPSNFKSAAGRSVLGKLNVRYVRNHSAQKSAAGVPHASEAVVFLDGRRMANNFEGVACYSGFALYAIGDDIFDKYGDPNDNASCYFAERVVSGRRGPFQRSNVGLFDLAFSRCPQPYPWSKVPHFRWED